MISRNDIVARCFVEAREIDGYDLTVRHFSTSQDAKEFLISRIVTEAQRDGVPLSELERKMLYFSETAWTLPDMMEVNEAFEGEYDTEEYEQKISGLIRSFRERAHTEDRNELEAWDKAVQKLRGEDHYILVMANTPDPLERRLFTRDGVQLVLTAFGIVCLIIAGIVAYSKLKGEL